MFPPILNTISLVRNPLPPSILPISWIRKRSRYMSVASGIKFWYSRHNFLCVHHCQTTAHNIYLIHTNLWKPYWCIKVSALLLRYQIRQKWIMMTKILLIFNFAPVRNQRLSHPLLLILFRTVQALPLTLSKMMMVRPSWAGAAVIALFPAIVVVLDSSSTIMHLRLCCTLQRGRTLSPVLACGTFLQMLSMP